MGCECCDRGIKAILLLIYSLTTLLEPVLGIAQFITSYNAIKVACLE
jgi:hypothetical protein